MDSLKGAILVSVATLILIVGFGCEDLAVENPNKADRKRALNSPEDVETLIRGSFQKFWNGFEDNYPTMALSITADNLTTAWYDNGQGDRNTEPRKPYNNDPAYRYSNVNEVPFGEGYSAVSSALDGLAEIEEGLKIENEVRTQRAKSFGQFVVGLTHAFVASLFDQGYAVDKVPESASFDLSNPPYKLKDSKEVFETGLSFFQKAINTAKNAPDFSIPGGWMGEGEFTKKEFIGIVKSYRAYTRASMPRRPEGRKEVDWKAVIEDINDGYTEMNNGQTFKLKDNPTERWYSTQRNRGKDTTFIRVDYRTIGPADTTDSYQKWLNSDLDNRAPFNIKTNDRRITGAGGPESDGKYMSHSYSVPFAISRGIYKQSHYSYRRNKATREDYKQGNSKWIFTPSSLRLLKAEGLLHLDASGNKAEIISIINQTRVDVGELDPASNTDPIGSMSDHPNALNGASLWSKLKYEVGLEGMGIVCGMVYFGKRGWNDLINGTILELPVPGGELQTLREPIYTSDVVENSNALP